MSLVSFLRLSLLSAAASLRQLLDSLNHEQRRNQELLASLAFALRSFTNLNRFLELVPLVAARLMEAEGALLLPFHADGRLWREQFHGTPPERSRDLLRQLAGFNDTSLLASAGEAGLVARYRGPSTTAARSWFTRIWFRIRAARGLAAPELPRVWPFQEEPLRR